MDIKTEKMGAHSVRYYGDPWPRTLTARRELIRAATKGELRTRDCSRYEVRSEPIAGPNREVEVEWSGDKWSIDHLARHGVCGETYVIYGYQRVGPPSRGDWELYWDVEVTL